MLDHPDTGDMVGAVALKNPGKHLAADLAGQVEVDVGQVFTARVEEAFHAQPVLKRVDVGDPSRWQTSEEPAEPRRAIGQPRRRASSAISATTRK